MSAVSLCPQDLWIPTPLEHPLCVGRDQCSRLHSFDQHRRGDQGSSLVARCPVCAGDGVRVSRRETANAVARPGYDDDRVQQLLRNGTLQRRYRDLAVVWLDAHGDFNTPTITISGYLGGMPLAMLTGRAPELFCDALGLRPVADTDVVLADARDLDPAEDRKSTRLNSSHVRISYAVFCLKK